MKMGLRPGANLLRCVIASAVLSFLSFGGNAQTISAPSPSNPTQDYLVYVVCESADKIVLLRFGPGGLRIENETRTGLMPTDINGPHGIAVSPHKKYFYVAEGHGRPDGSAWKYETGSNKMVKYTSLGLFPATTDITPDGNFIYVANANFHGDMVPSSISVVATDQMIEIKRITTCTMPHGSRLNPAGTKHSSACMMDDMLVEIDTATWKMVRRFPAGTGVYNLAMTKDGRLIATNKRGQSVSVFDPVTGKELARIPTRRKVVHGAVVTPDDHYAFISVEGVGSEPGTVEVIDLTTYKTAATIDVGSQAAGLDFWKTESSK